MTDTSPEAVERLARRLTVLHPKVTLVTVRADTVDTAAATLRAQAATLRAQAARIAALEAERVKDHAEINIKADWVEATINQLAEQDYNIEALKAKVVQLREALDEVVNQLDNASQP